MGMVTICLAHLVNSDGQINRYLLQESQMNALLKLKFEMNLLEGDSSKFKIPSPTDKTHVHPTMLVNPISNPIETIKPSTGTSRVIKLIGLQIFSFRSLWKYDKGTGRNRGYISRSRNYWESRVVDQSLL